MHLWMSHCRVETDWGSRRKANERLMTTSSAVYRFFYSEWREKCWKFKPESLNSEQNKWKPKVKRFSSRGLIIEKSSKPVKRHNTLTFHSSRSGLTRLPSTTAHSSPHSKQRETRKIRFATWRKIFELSATHVCSCWDSLFFAFFPSLRKKDL